MKIFSINSNNNYISVRQQRKHPITKGENDVVSFGASKIDIKDKQLAVDCAYLANYAYPGQKSTQLPSGYKDITSTFQTVDLGVVKANVFANSAQNRVYVAYSGTYNPVEFAKNAGSAISNIPRKYYGNALDLFEAVKAQYPSRDIVAVGHSAGGGLAQYVAAKHDAYAITYAPAGIGSFIDDLDLELKNYPKIINYSSKRDIVTKPFYNIGETLVLPVNTHSIRNYMKLSIYSKAKKLNPIACLKVSSLGMLSEIARQSGRGIKNGGLSILGLFKK